MLSVWRGVEGSAGGRRGGCLSHGGPSRDPSPVLYISPSKLGARSLGAHRQAPAAGAGGGPLAASGQDREGLWGLWGVWGAGWEQILLAQKP